MEIKDNKTQIPLSHYKTLLAQADPEEIAARTGVAYDSAAGTFTLHLLAAELVITWPDGNFRYADSVRELSEYTSILLLRFLLEGNCAESSGKFLAYPETPWGEVYYQQFRGRCILRLAFGFGFDPERFARACTALGGVPVPMGDRAFEIPFLENLRIRLILWEGDEEFQPSAQILFSDNFPLAFSAEDMAVVGDVLISAMKKA